MAVDIMYVSVRPHHYRCFGKMREYKDLDQMVLATGEYDHKYLIKNIKKFSRAIEIRNFIKHPVAEVFVTSMNLPCFNRVRERTIYVSHGMWAWNIKGVHPSMKATRRRVPCIPRFVCVASEIERIKMLRDFRKSKISTKKVSVVAHMCPQFDLIFDKKAILTNKEHVLSVVNFDPTKILLLSGFAVTRKEWATPHIRNYYRLVIEIEKIARENNYLLMVKPRNNQAKLDCFLPEDLKKKYYKAKKSKYVVFVEPMDSIYDYFFADTMIANGYGTFEVESVVAGKDLIVVPGENENFFDFFETRKFGVANICSVNDIMKHTGRCFDGISNSTRKKYTDHIGIKMDGKHFKRLIKLIRKNYF